METLNKSNVWSHLHAKTNEILQYWKKNSLGNGVTCFSKLLMNSKLEHLPNAGCHYNARYSATYAGLLTTTYVDSKFSSFSFDNKPSFDYASSVFKTKDGLFTWWVEFLLSVINDPDSYYYKLKDFVKVEYDKGNRPLAWIINGNAPHVCMTSFLVCTRKSKEKITPVVVYYLKETFPELGPMEVLSVAEIVCKRIDSKILEAPKNIKVPFENLKALKELMKNDGHVHCAQFHPNLHAPNEVSITDNATISGLSLSTRPTHEMLGRIHWGSKKEALEFMDWINNYGAKQTDIKPLFHKIRESDKVTLIPLDEFVAKFQKFIKEINKK